ncbi:hypothetical protein L7F22_052069 [Adiantum nelumboides]|nr:hypothetical protein [Adiantum nelumboides]
MEEQLSKAQQKLNEMELQLMNVQHAKVMIEDQNKQVSLKLDSKQKQTEIKEKQLTKSRRHKDLLKQIVMFKYLVQSLQDMSTLEGNITLKIADAQEWIHWVIADLEDKAETFTHALVNEALVSHLKNLENVDDEEEDGDEDQEDQASASRHPGFDDDKDDDQDQPRIGLSSGGTTTKPPPPPASQPKPPLSKDIEPEQKSATGIIGECQLQMFTALLTYKKRSTALVPFVKEKGMATNSTNGSLTDIIPWRWRLFFLDPILNGFNLTRTIESSLIWRKARISLQEHGPFDGLMSFSQI